VAIDRDGYVVISGDPAAAAPTWSAPVRIDGLSHMSGLSCPSSGLCVAVDLDGNVVISTDPAAADPSWSTPVSIDAHWG